MFLSSFNCLFKGSGGPLSNIMPLATNCFEHVAAKGRQFSIKKGIRHDVFFTGRDRLYLSVFRFACLAFVADVSVAEVQNPWFA